MKGCYGKTLLETIIKLYNFTIVFQGGGIKNNDILYFNSSKIKPFCLC